MDRPLTPEELFAEIADEVYRDGVVTDHERQLLTFLHTKLELPVEAASRLMKESRERFEAGKLGPQRGFDKDATYRRVYQLVHRDGVVDPQEAALLDWIRRVFRIDEATAARLITGR